MADADTTQLRPAVRELLNLIRFRSTCGRPCYIKLANAYAALIVPHLTDGPDGPYSYLRTFRRATLNEAVELGLVRVGVDRVDVPPIGGKHWSAQPEMRGRTIALTQAGEDHRG